MSQESPTGLSLSAEEKAFLLEEVQAFAAELRSDEARRAYAELRQSVEAGTVPAEQVPWLERLLSVGLETGRLRRLYRAPGEMTALRLFARTPQGRALEATAAEANQALAGLRGQVLEEVQLAPRGPGVFTLRLGTDRSEVTLVLDRHGVRLQSLELNL